MNSNSKFIKGKIRSIQSLIKSLKLKRGEYEDTNPWLFKIYSRGIFGLRRIQYDWMNQLLEPGDTYTYITKNSVRSKTEILYIKDSDIDPHIKIFMVSSKVQTYTTDTDQIVRKYIGGTIII